MSVFIPARFAQLTATLEYAPSVAVIIDKFTATNTTATAATITVYIGSQAASQTVYFATIPANSTDQCHPVVGQDLNTGEPIYVKAGTAGAIVIRAGGRTR